jgi:hypothetical protein
MYATYYTRPAIANVCTTRLVTRVFWHGRRLHVRDGLYVDWGGARALHGDGRVECTGADVCTYVGTVRAHYSAVDITCARPTQFNGHTALRVYGVDDKRADQLMYGAVLSFNCTLGYVLLGPETWMCGVNGLWSTNTLPTCTRACVHMNS